MKLDTVKTALSVCVCAHVFTSVFLEPWGLYRSLVKEKESPLAISVKENNRSTLTPPEEFSQRDRV